MKEQEMKRLIEENIPETPEAFHDRMNQTLNSIVVQERCQRMLETKDVPVRRARRLSFALTAALSLVLVAAVAVAAIHWNVFDHLFGNTPENADQVMQSVVCRQTINNVEITVDEGDSVSDVAKKLKDAGLVNSKGFFQLASGFLHYSRYVEPGTYKLNSDMDFRALIVNMHDWEQDSMDAQGLVQVTIPEGYTVRQIIDLLAEKGVATKAELEDACANFDFENYSFLSSDTLGSIDRMEGFLFPTTYTFDKNKTAVFAVDTMLTMFKNQISQQMLEDIKNSPYDLKQIITMASIIEKESIGDDTERKNISSVIHNRLEQPNSEKGGRLLQLCSSINYIMVHDGISKFDTTIESPYNTYIHEGLTPGPICNPGLSAIKAAIYPADTDYYFFALGTDDKSHFFTDYNEHLRFINSAEYQPIYS